MSKYQVRLGENVTDKIVNCGAGVYWYIEKLQSEIERLKEKIKGYEQERERVLNIIDERNHNAIEYIEQLTNDEESIELMDINSLVQEELLKILKGVDKE